MNSRKFQLTIISVVMFVILAVTKTVEFTNEQVMIFILGLSGMSITGHVVSDVASMMHCEEDKNEYK